VFEKVLFPVLDNMPGAAGSRWTSTATIENPGLSYVETFNRLDRVACFTRPCMELRPPSSVFDFDGVGFPGGALLFVPRESSMVFGLRVADTSRENGPGTELMPVRESQFFRSALTLVNVPIGPAYRTKVRIYALDPLPQPYVNFAVQIPGEDVARSAGIVALQRSSNPFEPSYAEVDLGTIPQLQGGTRATVSIHPSWQAPTWAFASAVHNTSQRVLIVRPQ
jgi:hypothetical protein